MLSSLGKSLALLLLVTMTIGCDRVTKQLAIDNLAGEPAHSYLAARSGSPTPRTWVDS
jgi:hypothetical protein